MPLRCPSCNREASAESLVYSAAKGEFVCPACASGAASAPREAPVDPGLPARLQSKRNKLIVRSPLVVASGLFVVAAIITTVAILVSRHAPQPVDPQRAWDEAH